MKHNKTIKVFNIIWDIEEMKAEIPDNVGCVLLPDEIDIPESIKDIDRISDYISEITGYCHRGFQIKLG